jgi:hypothetical protein
MMLMPDGRWVYVSCDAISPLADNIVMYALLLDGRKPPVNSRGCGSHLIEGVDERTILVLDTTDGAYVPRWRHCRAQIGAVTQGLHRSCPIMACP